MGFHLKCALAKVAGDEAAQVVAAMRALFPPFVMVRHFTTPFEGVIAAYDDVKQHEIFQADFAAHGFVDEDAAEEESAGAIDNRLPQLSHELGALPLAYVWVDCFGGTCMFQGHVMRDGMIVHSESRSSSAHVRLFMHLGVEEPQWHFPPFTRGFMQTGVGSGDDRLPITFFVHARWDEPFRLAAMRASMLPPPWKITIMTERDCIVVYGEQFVASINTVDDHVELRGKSFADLTLTKTLAGELADDDIALDIKDADGKPV
jgi:hypothetical protein